MAETATNDDRVKDRLGGWQGSETRKSIYQDRETDELRAQAASVRRKLRIGRGLPVPGSDTPIDPQSGDSPTDEERSSIDGVWASLTAAQRKLLLAKIRDGVAAQD